MAATARRLAVLALLGLSPGCGPGGVRAVGTEPWPERLSQWRLFVGDPARLEPNAGVLAYSLNTPLFSDYALKHRTVWMPTGAAARARGPGLLELPRGTILSKTFFYYRNGSATTRVRADAGTQRLLIETRLLVHARQGWIALPYVWNAEQSDATLEIAGDQRSLVYVDAQGTQEFEYLVPNVDQCVTCHVWQDDGDERLRPLGPSVWNLDRAPPGAADGNQLEQWQAHGYLAGIRGDAEPLPSWDDATSGSLEQRARAYLDVQCAHCHGQGGPASTSGLYLGYEESEPLRLGICKTPVAAGRGSGGLRYDVVPGRPDESILAFRMASREPDVMMPELGRSLRHDEGLDLVRRWISALPGGCAAGDDSLEDGRPRPSVPALPTQRAPGANE